MKTDLFDLTGEVAVVLGGTGGLGGAMAAALAAAGAKTAVLGRNAERGEERVRQIEADGGTAVFLAADALDTESLTHARNSLLERWGGLHILINAAGGNRPDATLPPGADFSKLPLEAWQDVFDLNLIGGALLPCQVFGETMRAAGRGSIVNIASLSGMTPLSRVVAYSAAKAAVLNLTQFLAREWATDGVRVNAISPGFFPAEQNRQLLFNQDGSYSDRSRQIIGHTPMSRFGVADELAGAVIFLASSRAFDAFPDLEPMQWWGYAQRRDYTKDTGFELHNCVEAGEPFERLVDHPSWINHVRRYCGEEKSYVAGLFIDESIASIRISGGHHPAHSGGFQGAMRGMYLYKNGVFRCGQCNILCALTDIHEGDGPTMVVPGSHKSNFPHPRIGNYGAGDRMDDLEGAIPVYMNKGDALLFVDGIIHGGSSRTNTTGERRVTIYRYGPIWGASRFGYGYSEALLARLTPERRKILQPVDPSRPPK